MNDQSGAQLKCLASRLFQSLDKESLGYIPKNEILRTLKQSGIQQKNHRIKHLIENIQNLQDPNKITCAEFVALVRDDIVFIQKICVSQKILNIMK